MKTKKALRQPLVTVITIVYNGEPYLEKAIQSVLSQTYPHIEYIIIDGGSTDGSLNTIKNYEKEIDKWISEPDNGISHAFNKGVARANGEIIAFLNSDDWYEINAIENVITSCLIDPDFDIYYAITKFHKKYSSFLYPSGVFPHLFLVKQNYLTISHPSIFVRKRVFDFTGIFNEKYKIAMDYDFLLRAMIKGATFKFTKVLTTNFRTTGISSVNPQEAIQECVFIKKQLLSDIV